MKKKKKKKGREVEIFPAGFKDKKIRDWESPDDDEEKGRERNICVPKGSEGLDGRFPGETIR